MSKIVELAEEDWQAIETFGEVFVGSNRSIVVTGGVGLATDGEVFDEAARPPIIPDPPPPPNRRRSRWPRGVCGPA